MQVTAILCTYNRSRSLENALKSLSVSRFPDTISWKVIVVDNNSKDDTRQVVERFAAEHPGKFLYLFEPRQGKSFALNAGIQAADADVIAFVDDDVEVAPDWLGNLTSPLLGAGFCGVGGRILPEAEFTPPQWMDTSGRYALAPLAIFDLGSEPRELDEAPFGTNMAFRRQVFDQYGGFRTDLGPRPGSEIRNEDAEFGTRILEAGEKLWYEPRAVVYHSISTERLSKRYFLAWWFDKARADIRQYGLPSEAKFYIFGVPGFLLLRLAAWMVRWLLAGNPRRRFSCRLKIWSVTGAIRECLAHGKG